MLRLAKRELAQVTLDAHRSLQALAAQQSIAQVVAHTGIDGRGQITVQLACLDADNFSLEVEHPWPRLIAFGAAPAATGLDRSIGIAQLRIFEFHAQGVTIALPLHIGLCLVHHQAGLAQAQGPFDRARLHGQLDAALGLVEVKVQVRPLQTRQRPRASKQGRLELGLAPLPFGAVAGAARMGLPLGLEALESALRLVRAQGLAQGRRQGQALTDAGEGTQVQAVGTDLHRPVPGLFATPAQAHGAAGPLLALGGGKLQVVAEHRMAVGCAFIANAAAQVTQVQGGQARAPLEFSAVKGQVGGDAADLQGRHHVHPGFDRARALEPGVGVGAQLRRGAQPRRVQAGGFHIGLARPFLPATVVQAEHGLAKLPAQAEPLAPARRWRGVETQIVLVQVVAHHGGDVFQPNRLGARAGVVAPTHPALADEKFGLRKKPIQGIAVVSAAQRLPSQKPLALGIAPHLHLQALQVHLVKRQAGERAQR